MRVVLYAEGAGEVGGTGLPPAPGRQLGEELLGPGHILLSGAITLARKIPPQAIRFEQPLRTRGRLAKGSDLLSKRTLRQLLTWADLGQRPDLAVVLVDADGETGRRRTLLADTEGLPVTRVIAVAVQEFESWLIADPKAVSKVLGPETRLDHSPESLARREAKSLLARWCAKPQEAQLPEQIRLSLARHADPTQVRARSASYDQLILDLALDA